MEEDVEICQAHRHCGVRDASGVFLFAGNSAGADAALTDGSGICAGDAERGAEALDGTGGNRARR